MFMPWDAKTKITNVLSLDKTGHFQKVTQINCDGFLCLVDQRLPNNELNQTNITKLTI